jgi:hypothetical protein
MFSTKLAVLEQTRYCIKPTFLGNTGWSTGNACFSHKNNFVDFEDKTFLITQKRRYLNAFLT